MKLSADAKKRLMKADVSSSRDLNSQPGLLSYLLKRATSPMKFGDHTTPVFADALDNIFRAVLDDSVQENPLNTPMQDALLAQRKFSAKKSYNLFKVKELDEAIRVVKDGKVTRGAREVSIVSDLLATRSANGNIEAFVVRVGDLDLNVSMSDVDTICGGESGRQLWYDRNRHRRRDEYVLDKNGLPYGGLHGLKTSGKRVLCISAYKGIPAIRNFKNTVAELDWKVEEEERKKAIDYKARKFVIRRKPWELYENDSPTVEAETSMSDILTILDLEPDEMMYTHDFYTKSNSASSFAFNRASPHAPTIESRSTTTPIDQSMALFLSNSMRDANNAYYFASLAFTSQLLLIDVISYAASIAERMDDNRVYSVTGVNTSSISRKVCWSSR
jgi:hypothetical protein